MTRSRLRSRLSPYGGDLPASFWYLWFGTVINRLGGFAVPFLMLYLTARIGITPQTAALVVSALGAGSFLAQLFGGELSDRLGRRPVMMLSFLVTPVAMLALGIVHEVWMLVIATFVLGFFTDLFRPAMSAAIIDLVPADKRTRAFGYIYWAINLGAALAPIAAGLLANFDYFLLFAGDALTTAIFGIIVLVRVPETQSIEIAEAARLRTTSRLGQALRDPMLLVFVFLSLLVGLIYSQSHVTLPLEMAANGLPPSDYGLAIAVNGALIVLVTLHVARRVERLPRFAVMAVAGLLLGIGFGLTAFAGSLSAFALTVAIWTIGEVIGAAVAPVIVSEMSPPEMRGLYQGVWGSSWGLAFFLGPALGGFVFGTYGSDVLWASMFALGVLLFIGYLLLSIPARRRAQAVAAQAG
ncbi:MAG TPA: MFS transporter [Candidatus Limnocylindrales bacterium]|nr:MFS transporter [Candidatus Limnocylindrales bacterium]